MSHFNLHIRLIFSLLFFLTCANAYASPTLLGQTGLINMPDARIAEEGTLRFGLSYMDPYGDLWSSLSMFPRLELGARYTSISNTRSFTDVPGADYGTDKDKAFDAKLILFRETDWVPQISIGTHDFLGTRLFRANFIVLSKQYKEFDFTLGAGNDRLDGGFGGVIYSPSSLENWSFIAEYDAFDYEHDHRALESGAKDRAGGFTVGVNYRWGWLGAQLSYQDGTTGFNGYISIPLQQKEFIPKIDEPPPYTQQQTRPTIAQWSGDKQYETALYTALVQQDFKNVRLWLDGTTLEIGLSQPRIALVGRAVGRAVRTALLMSPVGTHAIKITYYTMSDLPVVSYEFTDLDKLDLFFSGQLTYGELLKVLKVSYADPQHADALDINQVEMGESAQIPPEPGLQIKQQDEGQPVTIKTSSSTLDGFVVAPINFAVFFNDPSGAFKYEWFALAKYRKYFGNAWFFDASARMRIIENVSDVTQPSNSTLPFVRTDVAEYKREGGTKVNNLLLNKFFLLRPRIYARASAGLYEEMFGGAGGQVLYLPKDGNWALDLSVDALRQRDTEGEFGFRDYRTTSALLAYHYRIKKYGVTFTLRGGRFLAKDDGVRFEFFRRFRSGFKIGAWYTKTNGKDETNPGKPGDPYFDKGVFMQIPLNSMLTKDTQASGGFAIAPWTRDVGQMVKSPGDLYLMLEEPLLLDAPEKHLLSDFHY